MKNSDLGEISGCCDVDTACSVNSRDRIGTKEQAVFTAAFDGAAMTGDNRIKPGQIMLRQRWHFAISEWVPAAIIICAEDAIIICDENDTIKLINQQTEVHFRYGREELAGRPIEVLVADKFRAVNERKGSSHADTANREDGTPGIENEGRRGA
ncbi:MAG: PAS domain S-box protein [Proteobacteria bacterium]|nr:PAS domain S-box protein [Pseudomonadota bacterium]